MNFSNTQLNATQFSLLNRLKNSSHWVLGLSLLAFSHGALAGPTKGKEADDKGAISAVRPFSNNNLFEEEDIVFEEEDIADLIFEEEDIADLMMAQEQGSSRDFRKTNEDEEFVIKADTSSEELEAVREEFLPKDLVREYERGKILFENAPLLFAGMSSDVREYIIRDLRNNAGDENFSAVVNVLPSFFKSGMDSEDRAELMRLFVGWSAMDEAHMRLKMIEKYRTQLFPEGSIDIQFLISLMKYSEKPQTLSLLIKKKPHFFKLGKHFDIFGFSIFDLLSENAGTLGWILDLPDYPGSSKDVQDELEFIGEKLEASQTKKYFEKSEPNYSTYLALYPPLREALKNSYPEFGKEDRLAWAREHYLTHRWLPRLLTDEEAKTYLSNYGDLQKASAKKHDPNAWAINHYCTNGAKEKRSYKARPKDEGSSSAAVRVASKAETHVLSDDEARQYIANYPDLQDVSKRVKDPLAWARNHYGKYAKKEGRSYLPL